MPTLNSYKIAWSKGKLSVEGGFYRLLAVGVQRHGHGGNTVRGDVSVTLTL